MLLKQVKESAQKLPCLKSFTEPDDLADDVEISEVVFGGQ